MNLFEQKNYRKAFGTLFLARKETGGFSLQELAQRTRIQPSYLTNVTKERAHFSADQIFAIAEALALSPAETDYLQLLMEWERAEHPSRKKSLEARLQRDRQENLHAEKVLATAAPKLEGETLERYYLDPNVELLHLYLRTEGAPTETAAIARAWGLSPAYTAEILRFLDSTGLARRKGKGWKVEPVHQLLPRTSPLCKPQQALKRARAAEAMQRISPEKAYSFSGTLSMNEETRTQIQARFLVFLKECEKLVLASSRQGVYHLQFDLFPWIER